MEPRLNFSPGSMLVLNIAIAFIMFGVALDIKPAQFLQLKAEKKALITGLFSQYMLLPFLTWILVLVIKPATGLGLGMLLVAACPGGNVSNFFTHLAKGHVALSVTLTAITSLLCFVVTPAIFFFWTSLTPDLLAGLRTFEISFLDLLLNMLLILLAPLLAGMAVNHLWSKLAQQVGNVIRAISLVILAGFIGFALAGNKDAFVEHIGSVFWIVLLHNGLALGGGYLFSLLLRNQESVNRAVAIETGIQNSALALVITFSYFQGNGYMGLVAAWWGVWHLVSGFSFAMFCRLRTKGAQA